MLSIFDYLVYTGWHHQSYWPTRTIMSPQWIFMLLSGTGFHCLYLLFVKGHLTDNVHQLNCWDYLVSTTEWQNHFANTWNYSSCDKLCTEIATSWGDCTDQGGVVFQQKYLEARRGVKVVQKYSVSLVQIGLHQRRTMCTLTQKIGFTYSYKFFQRVPAVAYEIQ